MSEHDEQSELFRLAALKTTEVPELEMLFAIPNGGMRNAAVAGQLQAEGVKAGIPDIFLAVARGGAHGLWIEMKLPGRDKERHGGLSPAQMRWFYDLAGEGYKVFVCYGWLQAWGTICEYLGITNEFAN